MAAAIMDKILKGAKVADTRPESWPAPAFKIAVNATVARSAGIAIRKTILDRAEVIG